MLNRLTHRIQEVFSVLSGKKKTIPEKIKPSFPEQNYKNLKPFIIEDEKLKDYLKNISIEFCFCEFGENRTNAGGNELSNQDRLEPSLSSLKKYFPNATYTVYSDFDLNVEGVNLKKVAYPEGLDKNHPRYMYRVTGYYKYKSLLESTADFKCLIDSDMFVFSEEIYRLIYLTELFGSCAAPTPRNLVKKDMEMSLDTKPITDMSNGYGHSYNQSPMTLWKGHELAEKYYQNCCDILLKDPSRNSRIMWLAAHDTKYAPYHLPTEWCVCGNQEGIGDEVILHVGHKSVAEYYNIKI